MSDRLPIEDAREAFESALARPAPVVVVAPTGSGKSTVLPGWLADAQPGPVVVVEPRRVACRALATWVARQRGESVGQTVGYRVRFDDRSGPDTRILFATPGVVLNLLADGAASQWGALLVDEFHERSWEIDMVVALARRARAAGASMRLVLCSATLDTDTLVERLAATRVEARGRRFAVEIEYAGGGLPSARDLESRVAAAVAEACERDRAGDVLVFLPGKGEIERCVRAIAEPDATVVPVHGGLPPEALMRAFAAASGRRVFVATNVAETSLTLPGVTTVIDSGLARRRQHQAGRSVLALAVISKASMDQRAGRAGRVAPGRCIRLWDERFIPEPVTPPEIARIELDDLVVRAASCGLRAPEIADAPWVDEPPSFALQAAIDRLTADGTLDAEGELTAVGAARSRLPVSPFSARMLARPPAALAALLADLVALVEVGRDLVLGTAGDERMAQARRECFEGATDEVEVQLRALWHGRPRAHGLHATALTETRKLARALRKHVGASADEPPAFDRAALVSHLLQRVPEAAFVPRQRAAKKGKANGARPSVLPWGNGTIELSLRPAWIPGLHAEEQPEPPKAGVVLELMWLGHGRSASGRGRLLLRCRPADLFVAGLGQTRFGAVGVERGRVWADVEHEYAGVVIHREREALSGPALCSAVATLIARGTLRKGLARTLGDDLHLLSVVEQAGEGPRQEVAEVEPWLAARLREAGLSDFEELALLSEEDLRPDVFARGWARGLDHPAVTALRDDFPRTFAFEGSVYTCRVELAARRVTLEAHSVRGKKGGGEPPARVLPRFRGFAVFYRKASRQLRLR